MSPEGVGLRAVWSAGVRTWNVIVRGAGRSAIASQMQAAFASVDRFGRLLCCGIAAMVFSHTFVNIAMTVGLLPITGLPLPLLSYGGSFMIVMMASLGIVQSVYIRSRRLQIVYQQASFWGPGMGEAGENGR